MFDSLRDRKSNRKDEVSTAVESGEDIPEIAETAAKASPGRATARQTPATRSAAGAQRSKPTITEQMKRVSQFANNPLPGTARTGHSDEAGKQKLTVGPGIHLKGDISNCDTLQVQGQIEASAKTRKLEISDCGTFIGTAQIETADISGRFEGDLIVEERLIIRASGRISGKIQYNSIQIEAGGEISGEIHVTEKPEPIEEPEPEEEVEPDLQADGETKSESENIETKDQKEIQTEESEIIEEEPKSVAAGGS